MQPQEHAPARAPARRLVTGLALVAVLLIGWIDYVTGPEAGLSLFYLGVVVACGWWAGRAASTAIAAVAAVYWFLADVPWHGPDYLPISVWNAATRLVIFVFAGLVTARVRGDRERLVAMNARLQELLGHEAVLARRDDLTGLPNTRAFMETLALEIARSRRQRRPLCLAYLDVDNFKRVNDDRGHSVGDELLKRIAEGLKQSLRVTDVPARLGGDEFGVLLAEADCDQARAIAERVVERVQALASEYPGLDLGASVGLAWLRDPPDAADDLLRRADEAMYKAKAEGRGRVVSSE